MENNYRIHTNIINDTVLNVNLKQDFDNLEVLSLKLRQEDAYKLHSSSYGVIIGRVLANDAFGIPNAKVSVFIEKEDNEDNEIESIYPYKAVSTRDSSGRRYNLLPDSSDDSCYRIVGTFPQKRLVLDEGTELEIYEKYWKYTTVTNESGDYMIFGVPEGSQNLHLDIDLSDIGMLSQKPRDFIYKGYNINQFDNASQFKESTNLDGLAQIFSQDKGIYVYPFWGDEDNNVAAITRADFQVQYKFEPTCVFMGSIMSDNQSNSIGHKCEPSRFNGYNDQLVTGEGTIEMIRKTIDGLTEEYQIQGNQLINGDGVWCYQIPMNLDYIGTDEYGNIVPVDSPSKGIPTRARVRFRISKIETGDEGFSRHTAKYLVPNNIPFARYDEYNRPVIENGNDIDDYFEFGSSTPTECYRDLYWNKVYSVKNYIPRLQVATRSTTKKYSGLRATNLAKDKAIVPFNKLRFDIPFNYSILCLIFKIIVAIVTAINGIIVALDKILCPPKILGVRLWCIAKIKCIAVATELTADENKAYFPGCDCGSKSVACGKCPDGAPNCERSGSVGDLNQRIEQKLAEDYDVAKLDFYDDWLNGTLYMPLWRWRKRRKKSFLFGLIHSRAKSEFCSCDTRPNKFKKLFSCSLPYKVKDTDGLSMTDRLNGKKYHKDKGYNRWIRPTQGIIKEFLNNDSLEIYYYTPGTVREWKKSYKNQTNVPYVRMFATDIILLGSLNENDIDGVPQLFKYLPSTTENTPAIATEVLVSENESDTDTGNALDAGNDDNILGDEEKSVATTTGMDWGRNGNETDNVAYGNGLFMDIDCWNIKTKPKSCINVERLCELGVSFDSNYVLQYGPNANDRGEIFPDGMITKFELDGIESRAMFATLNHVGFIPSPENQIMNKTTGYKSNKFEYLYPTDFDGRLDSSTKAYVKSGYMQKTKDIASRDYQNFRFGSDDTNNWYFYLKNNDGAYHFPVYNNSFYFYFGLNPGKTAIDKFNQLFFAECYSNKKYPFSIKVTSKANNNIICEPDDMGYILVKVDDIDGPYYVQLFDYDGNEVGRIENLDSNIEYVAFGGFPKQENGVVNVERDRNDRTIVSEKYEEINKKVIGDKLFVNGNYTVRVVDSNGRYIESKVEMERPSMSINYESYDLSTKYFEGMSTKQEICDNGNQFYGQINVTSVTIDNEDYSITNVAWNNGGDISGKTDDDIMPNTMSLSDESGNTKEIQFGLYVDESYSGITNCLCDSGTTTQPGNAIFDKDNGVWKVFIYVPTTYIFKFKEKPGKGCVWQDTNASGSTVGSHIVSIVIQINNGDEFNLLVNTVPFKFMVGTTMEDRANYSTNFYPTSVNTEGWYKAYDESVYGYKGKDDIFALKIGSNPSKNIEQWTQFIDFDNGVEVINNDIIKVLLYKFSNLFTMTESIHMTEDSSQKISVDSVGGSGAILARMLRPAYEDFGQNLNGLYLRNFIFGNDNKATNDGIHPTIVPRETATIPNDTTGWNDHMFSDWKNASGGTLNKLFTGEENSEYIYNYFAQFTKNGGIVSSANTCKTDPDIKYQSIPYKASTYSPKESQIYGICAGNSKEVDTPVGKYDKVIGTGRNSNYPYIAVPFIDRRFDYEFDIYMPNSISGAYAKELEKNEGAADDSKDIEEAAKELNVWKINGYTYNGIEMAYDDNYQIIGSDEYISSGETKETPTRLGKAISSKTVFEYQYETESGTTTFNENSKVWRMPYDLIINGCRGLNTNVQNKNNSYYLNENFVDVGDEQSIKKPTEKDDSTGWFKKEFRTQQDFSAKTYPLKHNFQLSATTAMGENAKVFDNITFEYTSCSYDITPEYNDAYSAITTTAQAGENVKFTIVGNSVISYTQNDKDYNFEYALQNISGDKKSIKLKVKNTNIAFHINIPSEDTHNIYVHLPAIVNLKKIGIKRLKNYSIDNIIIDLSSVYKFSKNTHLVNLADKAYEQGMSICRTTGGEFKFDEDKVLFKDSNDAYLKANDYSFTNITFSPDFTIPEGAIFSIMLIREYMNKEENYMNRHIKVFSMTDPIDTSKPLTLKIESNDGKKIGLSVKCDGFKFDNAEYYMVCSATTSDEEATSVNIDGIPNCDIIYFNWDSIESLARPIATFYAKLENGLILKVPMRFNSTVIKDIKNFFS